VEVVRFRLGRVQDVDRVPSAGNCAQARCFRISFADFRPDFRLLIASATLNATKFSDYFDGAPVFRSALLALLSLGIQNPTRVSGKSRTE
jgi:hypothetical protein